MLGPLHLEGLPEAVGPEPAVLVGSGQGLLEAHVGQLAHGTRRQPVPAGLDPGEVLLLHHDHVPAGLGQPVGARGPRRAATDDHHIVHGNGASASPLHRRPLPGAFGRAPRCAWGNRHMVETSPVDQYLPILILGLLGLLFTAFSLVSSAMLAPRKKPTVAKLSPYECGIVPTREPPQRFPVRFYLVSMIFIIFDIEIVFLYPWAVVFHQIATFGLIEVIVFAAVVFVSFLYLISNGALTWGPPKTLQSGMPSRTSESTISRISAARSRPDQAA